MAKYLNLKLNLKKMGNAKLEMAGRKKTKLLKSMHLVAVCVSLNPLGL